MEDNRTSTKIFTVEALKILSGFLNASYHIFDRSDLPDFNVVPEGETYFPEVVLHSWLRWRLNYVED